MDDHLEPGGAYCFKGWTKDQSNMVPRKASIALENSVSEFDEWKDWMKQYVNKQEKNNKKNNVQNNKNKNKKNKSQDVAWETQIGQVREIQRLQAKSIATAIKDDKKSTKLAKIFQERFERSEKFAIVSEPRKPGPVQSPKAEESPEKNIEKEEEFDEEVKQKQEEEPAAVIHPALPPGLSFCNPIDVSHLFQTPPPWMKVTEDLPPPPPEKNFNRTPKLFTCSYDSPYY